MNRTLTLLIALSLFASGGGSAFAGAVRISDSSEGVPTVQAFDNAGTDITATSIVIQTDSTGEFLHFTFTSVDQTFANSFTRTRDLLESNLSLSDRLVVIATAAGSSVYDIKFASDPSLLTAVGNILTGLDEDGSSQLLFDITTVGGSQAGTDNFFVQSDIDAAVPEPGSLLLFLGSLGVLAGGGWMRRRTGHVALSAV